MTLQVTYLKPKITTFLGLCMLGMACHLLVRILFDLFTSWNAFDYNSPLWWFNLIMYPSALAVGVTLGARSLRLTITTANDYERIKQWTLEYFVTTSFRLHDAKEKELTLRSVHRFNRAFGDWFGTELLTIKQLDGTLIIDGPSRHVHAVDAKLRFGQPLTE